MAKKRKKPSPQRLIDLYKIQIEKGYEKTEIEQPLSEVKVKEFEKSSQKIIEKGFNLYNNINFNKVITKDYNHWFIGGIRTVIDKSAYSDDQEADYSTFDSFLAESVSDKFQRGISETFYYSKSIKYLIKPEEVFKALDCTSSNEVGLN